MTSATRQFTDQLNLSAVTLKSLPTMYDLPSEYPDEPGLPDEFHCFQPQLLSRTLRLRDYAADNHCTGSDICVYYDLNHTGWHKCPDWFLAVNVPRVYDGNDLRASYVVWQEQQVPTVIVEFLSLNTERQDLGRFYSKADKIVDDEMVRQNPAGIPELLTDEERASKQTPPDKFTVYEQYLKTRHYLVYSRYTCKLRYFKHNGSRYEEQAVRMDQSPAVWLDDLNIGLTLWDDYFEGLPGPWLRWCDQAGNLILTDTEQAQSGIAKAQASAAQAQADAARLAAKLRELGIDPNDV